MKWINVTPENVDIYGVSDDFKRLPEDVAKNTSENVYTLMQQPAGGRIRFSTNSKSIRIKANITSAGTRGFDLFKLEYGREIFATGYRGLSGEYISSGCFESREKESIVSDGSRITSYTLNLPHDCTMTELEIGIDDEASFGRGACYINEKPIIFYGSSITHGFAASAPGHTYEALISQKYNLNYVNLGFSGSAKGEKAIADYIASLDMCAFVLDYDHNAYEEGQLEATHYPFYKTVRDKHPDIPIIMVTRPDYFHNPVNNEKRAKVVYSTYERAILEGDKNVYFIHGKTLFSGEYYHNCTSDGCHPNDIGMFRMAKVIGDEVARVLNLKNTNHDYISYL